MRSYRYHLWLNVTLFGCIAGCGSDGPGSSGAAGSGGTASGAGGTGTIAGAAPMTSGAGPGGSNAAGMAGAGAGVAGSAPSAGSGGASAGTSGAPSTSGAAGASGSPSGGTAATAGASGSPSGGALGGGGGAAGGSAGGGAGGGKSNPKCPAGPFGNPVAGSPKATRVSGFPPADDFNNNGAANHNIEGPVWIGDALYVSEFPLMQVPPSRILKITATGTVSIAHPNSGTNGLAVDGMGNLVAGNHAIGAVVRYTGTGGSATNIVTMYDGKRFNSPNDLAVRSDGTIYFSDPDWQAGTTKQQTRVYRIAPGAMEATVVDASRSQPNGVTLSLDESTLYVTGTDGLKAYPVMANGAVGAGVAFGNIYDGRDGMGLDCAGNLYVTGGGGVTVVSPAGMQLGTIGLEQGAGSATNAAFGGPDGKTLYITTMGSGTQKGLHQVTLTVPGLPY